MALMVLSALAETSKLADGLNLSAVGGNECAAKIFNNGCDAQLRLLLIQSIRQPTSLYSRLGSWRLGFRWTGPNIRKRAMIRQS